MCYKAYIISHYITIIRYYTLLFFLLFFLLWHMGLLFFLLFFLLYHIIFHYFFYYFQLWHSVSTQKMVMCMQQFLTHSPRNGWLVSIKNASSTASTGKAHIKNGKQPEAVFQDYYTHYFYYYTHYFSRLTRIAVAVSTSYALQIYVHRFCVLHQA